MLALILACAILGTIPALSAADASHRATGTRELGQGFTSNGRSDAVPAPPTPAEAPATVQTHPPARGRLLARLRAKSNLLTLAIGGVAALAIHPADRHLTAQAAGSHTIDEVFDAGATLGSSWMQVGGAAAVWAVGRATDRRAVRAVGADLVKAQVLAAVLTQGLKLSAGRTRPDESRFSFPSGHTSAAFATATVLQRHGGWTVGVPAFALGAYVGVSRLAENRHYPSDVLFGAALGVVAGRTTSVGRGAHPFVASPVALPGGIALLFSRVP